VVIPLATFPAQRIVPFDPGGVLALLDLPGLIDRPDRQAAAPCGPLRAAHPGLHREPAHYPDRRRLSRSPG
jgi:hypothetical protein